MWSADKKPKMHFDVVHATVCSQLGAKQQGKKFFSPHSSSVADFAEKEKIRKYMEAADNTGKTLQMARPTGHGWPNVNGARPPKRWADLMTPTKEQKANDTPLSRVLRENLRPTQGDRHNKDPFFLPGGFNIYGG